MKSKNKILFSFTAASMNASFSASKIDKNSTRTEQGSTIVAVLLILAVLAVVGPTVSSMFKNKLVVVSAINRNSGILDLKNFVTVEFKDSASKACANTLAALGSKPCAAGSSNPGIAVIRSSGSALIAAPTIWTDVTTATKVGPFALRASCSGTKPTVLTIEYWSKLDSQGRDNPGWHSLVDENC